MAPLDEPTWCNGAATWLTPEARHFLRLMELCDDAMFSVLLLEPSGACTILFVSPGVTRLLGYTVEEYLALGPITLPEAVHPDDLERAMSEMLAAQAEEPKRWHTLRYREARKDASWADIESLFTTRGNLFYGVTRDATGARVQERHLKDLLLSTSFDLRCSATSVISAASLLRSRPCVSADAEAAFLADAVRTSCDMLSGLASNVLELRRLERGELTVTRRAFSLVDTVRGVLQMCRMAKCGGADLVWADEAAAAAALPSLVESDPVLIALIVQNLVTNALKFSNNSRVTVRVAVEPRADADAGDASAATLRIDVEDRGVGLAPADRERIFAKYERAAPDKGGGAGLGLHISRGFARAMDGDVFVESQLGEGSTFTMRVPVRALSGDEAAAEAAAAAATATCTRGAAAGEPCKQDVPAPDLSGRVKANVAAGRHPCMDPFRELSLEDMLSQLLHECSEVFAYTKPLGDDSMPRFAYVSPSVRSVLGWAPEQLVDRPCSCLTHPDDVDKQAAATAALAASESDSGMMFCMRRMLRADGSYLWMHLEVYQVGDLYYALWRDATRYKESQSSLKEYLLATSHDMRTPVTGIITAAQLLEARPAVSADSEAAFLVQTIKSCGGLMNSVISNVMELRSLDSDESSECSRKVMLRPVPFDPRGLVDDVLLATCGAMGHDRSRLRIEQPAPLPPCVVADAERMQRTLQNIFICLLRHATDDAQLRIRLACAAAADADAAELQLDLHDPVRHVTNEGDYETMFTPYFTSKTPDVGGLHSGLGLCMARAFMRAMGGELSAERMAPPGCAPSGIAIHLRLPVRVPPGDAQPAGSCGEAAAATSPHAKKRAEAGADAPKAVDPCVVPPSAIAIAAAEPAPSQPQQPPQPSPSSPRGRKHILLVEDHELNLKLVTKLLRNAGFVVSTATNGADALLQLQAAAALPDAVLTDIQMPIMDGLQLARAFRAWEATVRPGGPLLPVIALSANALDEHVQQSYDAGMTCHFTKPLRLDAVQELRRIINCAAVPAPAP